MFNGLVREVAKVKSFKNNILEIQSDLEVNLGDSVAVNGACLSVVKILDSAFCVELSNLTQQSIAIENYKNFVHIEPAMRLDSRLDGHFMQGHIDYIGTIKKIEKIKNQVEFTILAPKEAIELIIPRGSIGIDGVSLTIADVYNDGFKLVVIPITYETTLFKDFFVWRRVNIETDMLVRAVAHILKKRESNNTWSKLDDIALSF